MHGHRRIELAPDTELSLSTSGGINEGAFVTTVPTATPMGPGMSLTSQEWNPPLDDPDSPAFPSDLAFIGLTLVNVWIAAHLQDHFDGIREFLAERKGG